jgi:GT2 family glycosyltransferase
MGWRLPTPPSPEELARTTPPIPPVPSGEARPQWSVLIPTYNCARYLRRALASVLAQDPGLDAMQIEVVDDGSTRDDPAAVVAEVGRGRVAFHRNPQNLGATATFNVCLERSRGRWVHLLHGDDLVLPGFYAECDRALERMPDLVMIIGQVVMIDEHEHWLHLTGPPATSVGQLMPDFLAQEAVAQIAQFAGVAVRRDAYERAGGFSTLFGHVADRDMWFRVGQLGPVWCTPRPFGLYRVHGGQDTGQQMIRGTNIHEFYSSTEVNLARLGGDGRAASAAEARRALARRAYGNARKLYARGLLTGALAQAGWALRLHPTARALGLWVRAWARRALGGDVA